MLNRSVYLKGVVVLLCGLAFHGLAQEQNSATNALTIKPWEPQALHMSESTVLRGEIIGDSQILRALMKFGTNEFMFMIPPEAVARFNREQHCVLEAKNESFSITLRCLNALPEPSMTKVELKKWVESKYAPLHDLQDYPKPSAGHEGTCFEFCQTPRWDVKWLNKVVWVPCNGAVVEIAMTSDSKYEKMAQKCFDLVVSTLRSNEEGKIVVTPRCDKS